MGIEENNQTEDGSEATLGLELALERTRAGGKDLIADALLAKQTEKLEHELHHLKLRTLNEWFSLILKGLGALVSLAVVAAIALMAWDAGQSHALIVESFRSAPDLTAKGLDGGIIAAQVLDQLEEMRSHTRGVREVAGYSAQATSEAKLEIPDTGISVGELRHTLQDWLGHDTHISGALSHDGDQLMLTVRTGAAAASFKGPEADLDHLVGQAAEAVFAATQPLTFLDYLINNNRLDEALALAQQQLGQGSRADRAWAYVQLGRVLREKNDLQGARRAFEEATTLNPRLWVAWNDMADLQEFYLNDEEGSLASRKRATAADDFGGADRNFVQHARVSDQSYVDEATGDYAAALAINAREAEAQPDPTSAYQSDGLGAYEAAYLHDVGRSRFWMQRALDQRFSIQRVNDSHEAGVVANAVGYWQLASVDDWAAAAANLQKFYTGDKDFAASAYWYGLIAIAWARAGQPDKAQAIADKLPPSCDFCLLARGWAAEAAGKRVAADQYFALAVQLDPSMVRPLQYWGAAKLQRGDTKGAIALFAKAHAIGPRFADALEGWGEALLQTGDYDGAAAKFEEANRYAPKWGRNHLLWGQALSKLSKSDAAAEQFRTAGGLALSVVDRKALPKI